MKVLNPLPSTNLQRVGSPLHFQGPLFLNICAHFLSQIPLSGSCDYITIRSSCLYNLNIDSNILLNVQSHVISLFQNSLCGSPQNNDYHCLSNMALQPSPTFSASLPSSVLSCPHPQNELLSSHTPIFSPISPYFSPYPEISHISLKFLIPLGSSGSLAYIF